MNQNDLIKTIQDLNSDVNLVLDELLKDCHTPDEIIDEWNKFYKAINGSEQFSWINYKGKKILFANTSAIKSENWGTRSGYIGICFLKKLYSSFLKGDSLLIVINIGNAIFSREIMSIIPEFKKTKKEQFELYKCGMFGLTSMKRIVLNVLTDSNTKVFETKEDALEFVIS